MKNKQRHLNQKCSVLWLRIDAKTRMRKDFKLYKESDVFQLQTRKAKEVLGKELVDHGRDDDVETDEEIVKTQIKRCRKELRAEVKAYLAGNPFQ